MQLPKAILLLRGRVQFRRTREVYYLGSFLCARMDEGERHAPIEGRDFSTLSCGLQATILATRILLEDLRGRRGL